MREGSLEHLKARQLGVKFRRQQPVGPYILDFYSAEVRIGIEIDGPIHEHFQEYDAKRDEALTSEHILMLRFTNQEVEQDVEGVVATIKDAVEQRLHYRY